MVRSMPCTPLTGILLAMALVVVPAGCARQNAEEAEQAPVAAEFCEEHQISEAQCPYCDPSLVESLGFCGGHGVPEAFCYQCNPALIPAFKSVGDWCAGHDRPESQCYICNPQLDPANATAATSTSGSDPAPDSNLPRSQRAPAVYCSTQNLIVRLESPAIADQVGLEFAEVVSRPLSKTVDCNAEIAYDATRYARIATQVPGVIAEVHKSFGDAVAPGDPLVTITSAHLGAAKAAYLQALATARLQERTHAREKDLFDRGVSTEIDLLDAETHLMESRISVSGTRQTLASFGLAKESIDRIRDTNDVSASYVITAPFAGIVTDRHATLGEVVDASQHLLAIADVSRMWALIDVYESDLGDVAVGQPVVLQVEGLPGESFGGHLSWVSPGLNPQTRTLPAHAEIDNARGLLRANMFARATITVRDHSTSLVVPASAVQWEGCCNVVFVKTGDTVYEPRKVHLGVATGTVHEVLSGVSGGEMVVTQGSFLLKTEILKGSIGAGCCEVAPGK